MACVLTCVVLLGAGLYGPAACAGDPGAPTISFSGFGTLGLVHSSEANADFTTGLKPNGAGHTDAWSAGVDSRLGAQVWAEFTPRLTGVVQVVAEHRYDNSYMPRVEWANLKYQVTPDFSLRAGRIVLPTFLVSDYRKVGFANPWVRPPVEVYGLVPISNSDGVDASYRVNIGSFAHRVQAFYGRTEPRLPGGGTASARNVLGMSATSEFGAATVHVSYQRTNVTLATYAPLFDAFRQFGAQGVALAEKYDTAGKPFTFIGVGGMYDPGGWFLTGEWGLTDSNSVLGRRSAWYAGGGYRIGKFTPYVTYARAKADNLSDPGLNVSALPPFLVGTATGLNSALNARLSSKAVQDTISVGARWDFMKNTALKLQFDHTRIAAGSSGTLINLQPGFQAGGKLNVVSATIDFVF